MPAIYSKIPAVGIGITGLVIMISRVIDMITDPILGIYLDRMVEKDWMEVLASQWISFNVNWYFYFV